MSIVKPTVWSMSQHRKTAHNNRTRRIKRGEYVMGCERVVSCHRQNLVDHNRPRSKIISVSDRGYRFVINGHVVPFARPKCKANKKSPTDTHFGKLSKVVSL